MMNYVLRRDEIGNNNYVFDCARPFEKIYYDLFHNLNWHTKTYEYQDFEKHLVDIINELDVHEASALYLYYDLPCSYFTGFDDFPVNFDEPDIIDRLLNKIREEIRFFVRNESYPSAVFEKNKMLDFKQLLINDIEEYLKTGKSEFFEVILKRNIMALEINSSKTDRSKLNDYYITNGKLFRCSGKVSELTFNKFNKFDLLRANYYDIGALAEIFSEYYYDEIDFFELIDKTGIENLNINKINEILDKLIELEYINDRKSVISYDEVARLYKYPIDKMGLSDSICEILHNKGIYTYGDFIQKYYDDDGNYNISKLLKTAGLDKKEAMKIIRKFKSFKYDDENTVNNIVIYFFDPYTNSVDAVVCNVSDNMSISEKAQIVYQNLRTNFQERSLIFDCNISIGLTVYLLSMGYLFADTVNEDYSELSDELSKVKLGKKHKELDIIVYRNEVDDLLLEGKVPDTDCIFIDDDLYDTIMTSRPENYVSLLDCFRLCSERKIEKYKLSIYETIIRKRMNEKNKIEYSTDLTDL